MTLPDHADDRSHELTDRWSVLRAKSVNGARLTDAELAELSHLAVNGAID